MCSPSTSDVRFITFVNTSYIEAENLETVFDILLKVEVGFLIFSWMEFLYLFYLFVFIRAMHFNLTFLFMNYGGQYFCSMLSRCLIVYQQLGNDPNNDLHHLILVANYVRTIGLFIAMYILPIFMIERCLATFFVRNYEKSRKIWVSLMILSIFHPLVFASAIAYIQCWLPVVFHVISFFIVNIIGYIGIHICFSYNIKKHQKFYSNQCFSKVSYGLSERFQLAENIKNVQGPEKGSNLNIIFQHWMLFYSHYGPIQNTYDDHLLVIHLFQFLRIGLWDYCTHHPVFGTTRMAKRDKKTDLFMYWKRKSGRGTQIDIRRTNDL